MKSLLFPLKGVVQHYAWGGRHFIAHLLNQENQAGLPYAEYWMGDHLGGPSQILWNDTWTALPDVLGNDAESILGMPVMARFGIRLPFLFKVLDVQKMLSIQAHPTKKAAEEGFKRENDLNIPLQAAYRNYKDDNHKPEIMVALTPFYLLHGFAQETNIAVFLAKFPEFKVLQTAFLTGGIYQLYKTIMEMPQEQVDELLSPLSVQVDHMQEIGLLDKDKPDYWAWLAFKDYTTDGHYDRGIFSIYLFNLVKLAPGQAIYQAAGIPHAYLEGVNMELMANSDNVFRGGLTPKHIDVPELMKHLVFEPIIPQVLDGQKIDDQLVFYPSPAPDFEMAWLSLSKSQQYHLTIKDSPCIGIVIEGEISLPGTGSFSKGDAFLVSPNAGINFFSQQGASVYMAWVGNF